MIIPWVVYQTYGDTRILEESWKCMHEWVDYIHNHVNENGLWMTNYQYGDWLALDREMGDKKRWSYRCLLCGKRRLYIRHSLGQRRLIWEIKYGGIL